MKKIKLSKYMLAIAVIATAIVGIEGYTPKAEECVEETVATDTDAEAVVEELNVEENESSGRDVPYYNININGGSWDGNHYVVNGTTISDAFFCDGTYTYYLQYDGTPMKNRLTYHPNGEHVIYFDENGREVFSDFAMVKQSISGEAVDDMCFFDVYGYMYVNTLTYDKTGTKIYYVNEYGVIERNGWFEYSDFIKYFDSYEDNGYYRYGYANADGTLMTSQFTYNWNDKVVYLCGDGITIDEGIHNLGGTYYLFNHSGELVEQYSQVEAGYTYVLTEYYEEEYCICEYVYDGTYNNLVSRDYCGYDGNIISHEEMTYDDRGNGLTYYYYDSDGGYSYRICEYNSNGERTYEYFKAGDETKVDIYWEISYQYYDSDLYIMQINYDENKVPISIYEWEYTDDEKDVYKETEYVDGKKYKYTEYVIITESEWSWIYEPVLSIEYDTTTGEELYRVTYN